MKIRKNKGFHDTEVNNVAEVKLLTTVTCHKLLLS